MSFYPLVKKYMDAALDEQFSAVSEDDVRRALAKTSLDANDYMALISPTAVPFLEEMAQKASRLTAQNFGHTIHLFTPLYLSSFCSNHCVYCGFNAKNKIPRSRLTMEELEVEAKAISATGLKHLLILTGEAPAKAGVDYLVECMTVLQKHFPSVSIEVFAMDEDEYARLVDVGVDGLTLFQETYDETLYAKLHPKGPKKDFRYRIDAPERGCKAGMRVVNIGALLGLGDWRKDALLTGLHLKYLTDLYPEVDIAVSLPRMRPHAGEFQPSTIVEDRDMVQIMLAQRLFLPRLGITVSTRESAEFRENILPLGVTKMSAGVTTAVGGHTQHNDQVGQFEICDDRSVEEMSTALRKCGYQPVFKDWEPIFDMETTGV
ncbi:2-iminoacetate synthase ThiH [Pseudodesulfovibrio sediminis]|uniref:Thiamine biosynthesis protein ThiH n=1 Tax=Pseudodesulfovibrio sediminis TaxID=2810563 RepID=A0ABN6EQR9_9BACT|nr:2-iminoacetate synthase ThiH [Pseudodesulfovibrio sediminis]BCS87663.1 thiamine biosynthesis protein ThiH [Pseudodesulfovibrio sediminis]